MNPPTDPHAAHEAPQASGTLPPRLPPGYRLVRELTRGSSAWTGWVESAAGPAVLRIASDERAEAERAAELQVLAGLDHEKLARLVDHGTLPDGSSFVARSWVEGRDLRTLMAESGLEGEARARLVATVVCDVCDAIAYLHDAGFVHADLKAENVIVREDGSAVVTDFGLARASGARRGGEGVSGSHFSIAPEVLLGAEATPRSDLFALGMMLARAAVTEHARAPEFYARFPHVPALEALRVTPESLPEWGRDLIVALLALDPDVRPSHARVVGATLAARLGLRRETPRGVPKLAFPLRAGRTAFLESRIRHHLQRGAADRFTVDAWWLPPSEPARAWMEEARLFAALRGVRTRALHASDLAGLDGANLERFAREVTSNSSGIALFLGVDDGAPLRRAVEYLARAARQKSERGEGAPTALFVGFAGTASAASTPPAPWWNELTVPRVESAHVREYLEIALEEASSDRRERLAELLTESSDGSAARVGARLDSLCQGGWILWGETRARLRPGALPARVEEAGDEREIERATPAERRLLAALSACDAAVPLPFAAELARLDVREGAEAARSWLARGRIVRESRGGSVRVTGGVPASCVAEEEWVRLHTEIAGRRRAEREPPISWIHHEWRASVGTDSSRRDDVAARVRATSEEARERGSTDTALELHERIERLARAAGRPIEPSLRAEAAATWISVGAIERAEAIAEELARAGSEPRVLAARENVLGRVAFARAEYEVALSAWARAEALDPRLADEAVVARARVLYDARRDAELESLCASLAPEARPERGTSSAGAPASGERVRANVRTLVAMSRARSGDLDGARARLAELLEEARRGGDAGRIAALELNVGTVERRRGNLDEAVAAFHRALALLEKGGNLAALAQARVLLGGLWRERNDLTAAGPLLEGSAALRERLGDRAGAAAARGLLGLVHADRGHARAALSELSRAASDLVGMSRRVDAALLEARAEEIRARLGEPTSAGERSRGRDATRSLDADPRALLWRARAAWMRRDPTAAAELARRARDLARSLRQPAPEHEAEHVLAEIERKPGARATEARSEDERVVAAVGGAADAAELTRLAEAMAREGRDDRAARLWFALAARARTPEDGARALAKAEAAFAVCRFGLSETEARHLRGHLLARPDPNPDEFVTLDTRRPEEEDFPMDVLELLEINRRLVAQQALPDLLGAIVDSALSVTGAERGFVVLEENGEIAIQTALDSRRGDIAAPEVEVSHSIVRQALSGGNILRLSNASEDPELGDAPSVAALELRSILCAPFDIEPGTRGVVYVDHRLRRGAFDSRAERMLGLLAGQAALAVRQVRRLDEIRRLNRELEREVVHKETDLRAARAALRAAALVPPASGLVGESSPMRAVHELIARAAPSRLPVLVTGPSGTGKELAARALHAQSTRADGPFLAENVAALPAALIEAELFGHKKGAYTGADSDRAGLFERAHGGTVFLDEIGELGIDLQAKLLRVLETGEVRRLGDSATRRTDFRLVAATNRDLESEVAAGRFRADLMYRLDALRVAMPPLEARVSDVPLLVDHFLRLEEAKGGKPRRISPEVLARLCARAWPGNVRELSNEVARLCVLSAGDIVDPSLVRTPSATSPVGASADAKSSSTEGSLVRGPGGTIRTLAELEREAIEAAIAAAGGDKARAAEMLGISRAKVYQRVKEWRGGEEADG